MVKSKYVIRHIHAEDRRKTNLEVTESGIKIIKDVQKLVESNRKIALNHVTKEELETMNNALLKISENCINTKNKHNG
jgi:MarR family transcriptional regulator for hemolysin